MPREPGRSRTRPYRVPARAGVLITSLRTARQITTASQLTAGLIITGGLLVAACGPGSPAAFRPAGVATPDSTRSLAGQAHRAAAAPERPPLGSHVHIVMPGWLPADPGEVPAVLAAKDFLLAFLYAEYRGNQDDRWARFVSGPVLGALKANLSGPAVTTESFTGTIIFSHMRAYPDPASAGAVDVSECFDNSRSHNTDLVTGKIIPDRIPASQHYYMNTDTMAEVNGRWKVISVYPVVYYPRAEECKP